MPAATQQEGSWKVRSKQQENRENPRTGNRVFKVSALRTPYRGQRLTDGHDVFLHAVKPHFKIIPAFQAVVIAGAGSVD
ncbi:MAG TPA: hypothetical protein VIQ23_11000 [Hanamia sp.]